MSKSLRFALPVFLVVTAIGVFGPLAPTSHRLQAIAPAQAVPAPDGPAGDTRTEASEVSQQSVPPDYVIGAEDLLGVLVWRTRR